MRFFLVSLTLVLLVACGSEESDTSGTSSSQSSVANTTTASSSMGGSGQGGAAQGGDGAGGTAGGGGGTFACGTMLECQHGAEYCDVFLPGVPCGMPTYNCQPLPNGCQPDPSCSCIPMNSGAMCTCSESAEGDLTLTCAGI